MVVNQNHMKHFKLIFLSLLLSSVSLQSCKDDVKDEPNPNSNLNVVFSHHVNNMALDFDTAKYTNALNQNFEVSTLRYFVSAIYLRKANGDSVLVKDIHYVDARDNTGVNITKQVAAEEYVGLSLAFGIPAYLNQSGMFTIKPESNMEWPEPMGGGYHYMKFEGKFAKEDNSVQNFQMHSGPLMAMDRSIYFTFDTAINLSNDATVTINQHLEKWMTSPNDLDLKDITMIMGNPEVQGKIMANGHDVITLSQ
jgi:hypothetical protein